MDNTHRLPVAAAKGCVRLRSNRKPACTIFLTHRGAGLYGGYATGRSLRQLLRKIHNGLEVSSHA